MNPTREEKIKILTERITTLNTGGGDGTYRREVDIPKLAEILLDIIEEK